MSDPVVDSVGRAFCEILRARTGRTWKIEPDGNPSATSDGKVNPGAGPCEMNPVGDRSLAVAAPHENSVESGGK